MGELLRVTIPPSPSAPWPSGRVSEEAQRGLRAADALIERARSFQTEGSFRAWARGEGWARKKSPA